MREFWRRAAIGVAVSAVVALGCEAVQAAEIADEGTAEFFHGGIGMLIGAWIAGVRL